jgi:hypothetical protein
MNLDLSKVWWCRWAFSGVNNFNPNQKINIEISTSVFVNQMIKDIFHAL